MNLGFGASGECKAEENVLLCSVKLRLKPSKVKLRSRPAKKL